VTKLADSPFRILGEPNDDNLDEVAINVLLAEGVDVPTALEASRRDADRQPDGRGCMGATILLVVAVLAIVVLLF
jgi:hypothetical protein